MVLIGLKGAPVSRVHMGGPEALLVRQGCGVWPRADMRILSRGWRLKKGLEGERPVSIPNLIPAEVFSMVFLVLFMAPVPKLLSFIRLLICFLELLCGLAFGFFTHFL